MDRGNTVKGVRTSKQTVKSEVRRSCKYALGGDIDAVAVVVKGNFVEQRRADGIRGMNHGAIGGIVKDVADRGHVVVAPLRFPISLRNLLRNPVPEYGKFVGELVVDAGNFLPYISRLITTSDDLSSARGSGENTRFQQRLRIGIEQIRGNRVIRERRSQLEPIADKYLLLGGG